MKPSRAHLTTLLPLAALLVVPLAASAQTIYPLKLNPPLVEGGNVIGTPVISPDGTRVLYSADQIVDEVFELFSVPIGGGAAEKLNPEFLFPDADVSAFTISPDGNHVVYMADQDTDEVFELYSVPIGGGVSVKLNPSLGTGRTVSEYLISPDSSRVIYRANQDANNRIELYSVPIAGGASVTLNHPFFFTANVTDFQISPDSSRAVYRTITLGTQHTLHSVPIAGGAAVQLTPALPAGGEIRVDIKISVQSDWVVYLADQDVVGEVELFSVPIAGGATNQLNPQLVAGGDVSQFEINSDGSRVVYHADQDQDSMKQLYSTAIGGGVVARLDDSGLGGHIQSFKLGPDPNQVVYRADRGLPGLDLYSISIQGGGAVDLSRLQVLFGFVHGVFGFSLDGSRVIYVVDQETLDTNGLFSVSIGGGEPVKLSPPLLENGGVNIFRTLSPDGNRLIFRTVESLDDVLDAYSVPVAGGPAVKLNPPRAGRSLGAHIFHQDSSKFVYTAEQDIAGRIELYVGKAQAVWQAAGGSWTSPANWRNGILPTSHTEVLLLHPAVTRLSSPDSAAVVEALVLGGGAGSSVLEFLDSTTLHLERGATVLPGGVLRGDGVLALGALPLDLPAGAELRAGVGEHFEVLSGVVTNAGLIEASGTPFEPAEIEIAGALTNVSGTGAIVGREATLRFPAGVTSEGAMSFSGGFNQVHGDISNDTGGLITISGGATAIFYDDVTNNSLMNVSASGGLQSTAVFFGALTGNGISGGGHVFIEGDARPGFSPGTMAFGGDLSYGPFATLELELAGTVAGTEHDQLTVNGHLELGGRLVVTLLDDFVPQAGMVFDLWEASTVSGQFGSVELPLLPPGLFWHAGEISTTGELRVGLTPQSYAQFAAHYGLLTAPHEDEELDGVTNLLEYLGGRNPLEEDALAQRTELVQVGNEDQFRFLSASPVGSDLITEVETSVTLHDDDWEVIAHRVGSDLWSGSAGTLVSPSENGREEIKVTRATTNDARRFYRLRVSLVP